MDFLKTTEGSNLKINTLIDMASQARLFKCIVFSSVFVSHSLYYLTPSFRFNLGIRTASSESISVCVTQSPLSHKTQ